MPNPMEDRFRSKDLEALETGLYSDAEVSLGDRVWKVHRPIVCLRSGYMRKGLDALSEGQELTVGQGRLEMTEKHAERLLEFIYLGSIKEIDDLTLADCVELSILGKDFDVYKMGDYAIDQLVRKLTAEFRDVLTMPIPGSIPQASYNLEDYPHHHSFQAEFQLAVTSAYKHSDELGQLTLANFVGLTRNQLLHASFIEELYAKYPLFASHILIALKKPIPQALDYQHNGQLASIVSGGGVQGQVQDPSQALQLLQPRTS